MSVFTVLNPATEEPVTTVDQVSLEQTDEAIARAAAAWPAWREVAPGDRARLLRAFAASVDSHLEELAGLLGGVVGVSRVVTSEGWRPHKQQVGQTGTKITPELYLACGISGAIQHIAGCAGAKHIIAINTDPGAPILAHADYAIIGDLHQVIPALVEALRAR